MAVQKATLLTRPCVVADSLDHTTTTLYQTSQGHVSLSGSTLIHQNRWDAKPPNRRNTTARQLYLTHHRDSEKRKTARNERASSKNTHCPADFKRDYNPTAQAVNTREQQLWMGSDTKRQMDGLVSRITPPSTIFKVGPDPRCNKTMS
jgi:hypothetical protein